MLTNAGRRHIETAFLVLPPIALLWAMVEDAQVPGRSLVAAVFFLVSPGLALLAPARFRWELELAIVVPSSLAIATLVSLALFYAGVWTPTLTVVCLSALCALGLVSAATRDLLTAKNPRANPGRPGEPFNWGDVT